MMERNKIVKKTITSLLLVSFLASFAVRAEDGYVSSLADFEKIDLETKDVFLLTDQGNKEDRSGKQSFHWLRRSAAGKTAAEVVSDGGAGKALKVDSPMSSATALARTIVPRGQPLKPLLPILASNETHETICYSLRTQFKACSPDPVIGATEKIMVWMKASETPDVNAELYVTCGQFKEKLQTATAYNCRVQIPDDFNTNGWHTLAFRTIPDITAGGKLCGFTISLDGEQLVGTEDYEVLGPNFADSALLTAEARILIGERKLFPACGGSGSDAAVRFNGLAFRGRSLVDDILTTNEVPVAELQPTTFFSLRWDAGVASFSYTVDSGTPQSPTDDQLRARRIDFPAASRVEVNGVAYDESRGFRRGQWSGVDCEVSQTGQGGAFEVFASRLPVGYIVSGSDALMVGDGGYATFDEAIFRAKAQGLEDTVLQLCGDAKVIVPTNRTDDGVHKWGAQPGLILKSDSLAEGQTLTLDLNGHTLKGSDRCPTPIVITGGRLRIIDTAGGGRIEPVADYFDAAASAANKVAINDYPRSDADRPVLIIENGIIAGDIACRPQGSALYPASGRVGTLEIYGGEFASTNGVTFAYGDSVADRELYYGYRDSYWKPVATGACIWCGKGNDSNWSTRANWKNRTVPVADDLVIFPSGTNVWNVTFNNEAIESDLWIDGNVVATGSADLTKATVRGGAGEGLAGDATFVWSGALPPSLDDVLSPDWAGTVKVEDISSPTALSGIDTWGTSFSKVVFNNVNGYVSVYQDLELPYELVLEGAGWKNLAGYSGSTVTFRKLSGSGPFAAEKPKATIRQVIRFRDVSDYKGKFEIEDKRIVIGNGAAGSTVGSITYSQDVVVNSDLDWSSKTAFFEAPFTAVGSKSGVLLTYTGTAPDVSGAVVFVRDGEVVTTNGLVAANFMVKFCPPPENLALVGGAVAQLSALSTLKAGSTFRLLGASAKASGNTVTQSGKAVATLADYYTLNATADGVVTVALNAVPVIGELGEGASAEREEEDGLVQVVVTGARRDLYYGLQFAEELTGFGEDSATVWQAGPENDGGDIVICMAKPKTESGFYRVVVTDRAPTEEGTK